MRRGINMKKVLLSLDEESIALLEKYRAWGTPASAHVRKCLKSFERNKMTKSAPIQSAPEETAISYD